MFLHFYLCTCSLHCLFEYIWKHSFCCHLKTSLSVVELINKLNFLDEEEQDLNTGTNPFESSDVTDLNPFGDPDAEGN